MKVVTKSSSGSQKMPSTQLISLLDDRLVVAIRTWNGQSINQKIIDEITHFMSSVEADLEVTSPFGYSENLTMIANKVRISLLLANDIVLNSENKETYQNGSEVFVLFQKEHEIAWGSVGRFSLQSVKGDKKTKLFDSGRKFDDDILLPINLIGLNRDLEINSGSVSLKKLDTLELKSTFGDNESLWECQLSQF